MTYDNKVGTPGLNFVNILRSTFRRADSESVKVQLSCQYHFMFLGSAHIKAGHKMLMKLTPAVNFSNVLREAFTLVDHESLKRLTT